MINASRNQFLIALGSNASADSQVNSSLLGNALARFKGTSLNIEVVSRYWRTPAFPAGSGPDFANACAVGEGDLSAQEALALLHQIEAEMGRERKQRWGQRVIDLDLLAMGDAVLPNKAAWEHWYGLPLAEQQRRAPDELILPHPRLQDRAFVLVPLADVAADWVHPVLGKTVAQMVAALEPRQFAALQVI